MLHDTPWELIQKSFKKDISKQEQAELDQWLAASEDHRKLYLELSVSWNISSTEFKSYQPDKEAAWENISQATGISQQETPEQKKKQTRFYTLTFLRNAAAILFIPIMMALGYFVYDNLQPAEPIITEVSTSPGQRSTLALDDGTRIWLNAGSTLSYTEASEQGIQLFLEGEAFFDVPENRTGKFIVSTAHIDVLVTGTSFNVRAYPDEESFKTILEKGEVQLFATGSSFKTSPLSVMKPEQKAIYHKKERQLEVVDISGFEDTAWRMGTLAFRDASFNELANRIEKWFDVKMLYDENEFKEATFTGIFRNSENLTQVLESIRLTTPFNYEIHNNKEVIIE